MKTPEMLILCGLPASGKNTWLRDNQKKLKNYIVVELDWIRKELFGHQFYRDAEPFILAMAKGTAKMLLCQGKNIIINSTGVTIGIRNEWANMAKKYGYRTKVVFFDVDVATCHKRNRKRKENRVPDEVIVRMAGLLHVPVRGPFDGPTFYGPDIADKIVVVRS